MKFIISLIISIPCFLINAVSRDSVFVYEESKFEKFIERIIYSKNVKNNNLLALNYGLSKISYHDPSIISKISKVFLIELRYGFARIDENFKNSGFNYISSENAYLSNYSSHLTLKSLKDKGKTTDAWKFGFDFTNGYGYSKSSGKTFFIHSGGIGWLVLDMENIGETLEEQIKYNIIDKKFKFGTDFNSGIRHYFYKGISADILYRHSHYYPEFQTWKFIGSYVTELLIQRTIDYFSEDMFPYFPSTFPVVNWTVKSLVSIIFSEFQREKMYFPFSSNESLNYDCFKIGIMLTF